MSRQRTAGGERGIDLLDVIERAYDMEATDEQWLSAILREVAPAVERGRGVCAYLYDASARPLKTWAWVGEHAATQQELIDVVNSADDDYVRQSFLVVPFGTASEQPGFERQRTFGRRLHKYGIKDCLALNGFDQTGVGAWIGAFLPETDQVGTAERDRWSKVASHVAAALRLRMKLRAATERPAMSPEAILSPGGKMEHATGDVAQERSTLVDAVRRLERARGRLRRTDPDAAVEAWWVLVRGKWSLVDDFTEGGRRYLFAYRNAPISAGPAALTDREREIVALSLLGHSPKLVAYELGLAPSTVRVHLANASRKLGARSHSALLAKYRAWMLRQTPPAPAQ